MPIGELFAEAVRGLRAHALRSALTLLGIIIGVTTLVGVVSVINGLNAYVSERVISLAPHVFVVTKFGIIRSREAFLEAQRRPDIQYADYQRVSQLVTRAENVAAEAIGQSSVKRRDRRLADMQVHGTSANFGGVTRLNIGAGRYFSDAEDTAGAAVAVVGWDVKDELFPNQDPIGQEVLIGGQPYRVIGLINKEGRVFGENRDHKVFLPITSYRRQFGTRGSLNLLVEAKGGVAGLESSTDEVRAVIRAMRHTPFRGNDPFGLVTAEALQELWKQISAAAFILSLLISSVSLGVGGIVIMNIMLVAVVERTREIGVRLALGARKADIQRQFLLEAALLSFLGGAAGVGFGVLASFGVRFALDFPARATPGIMLLGLLMATMVGVGAGYLPARRASNLPVVEALRSE